MKKIRIGIIGENGAVGSFFHRFFLETGYGVTGSDIGTVLRNQDVIRSSDVVIFCVPVLDVEKIILEMAPYSVQGQLWIEVSSVNKEGAMKAMRQSRAEVIGIHTLAAPPKDAITLNGQTMVVCKERVKLWKDWFNGFAKKLEVRTVDAEPKAHDDAMLLVQNFIHLMAIVFPKVASILGVRCDFLLKLSTPLSQMFCRIVARVLSNKNSHLYANIQIGNPRSVEMIDATIKTLQGIRKEVSGKSVEGYVAKIEEAKGCVGEKFLREALAEGI